MHLVVLGGSIKAHPFFLHRTFHHGASADMIEIGHDPPGRRIDPITASCFEIPGRGHRGQDPHDQEHDHEFHDRKTGLPTESHRSVSWSRVS